MRGLFYNDAVTQGVGGVIGSPNFKFTHIGGQKKLKTWDRGTRVEIVLSERNIQSITEVVV